jgi:hypothetical protein
MRTHGPPRRQDASPLRPALQHPVGILRTSPQEMLGELAALWVIDPVGLFGSLDQRSSDTA